MSTEQDTRGTDVLIHENKQEIGQHYMKSLSPNCPQSTSFLAI